MPEGRVFPVWRGIWAKGGSSGGWTEAWERRLRWDSPGAGCGVGPVWLVLCRGAIPSHHRLLPPLFNIHQVPKVVQEDSIMSGYRDPCSTALDCVLSSFQIHNETINIWTHFLPTWYFVWRLAVLCSCLDFGSDPYSWPLLVYMLLICVYPFTSSCAHTFSAMSTHTYHICFFFDYGALSLYSLGCAISYGHYVIPECWVGTGLQRWFVPVALFNSLFCTSLSCYSRFVELRAPQWSKVLRTAAFVVPFIFDTVPLVHRLALCCGGGCGQTLALSSHSYHLLFALLTCFLFTSHLPERLAPGRFDYIVFPVWRGIWAKGGSSGGWTEAWERRLRWDSPGAGCGVGPVWLVLCRGAIPSHHRLLPPLFNIHQVPKVVQEDSIMSGYRDPCSTALDCVLSSFQIHNETINIWTHFLPTWYFVWRLAVLCSCLDFGSDPYSWPLLVYMLLICVYPFTSSCAHTFSAMSTHTYHICFFFDYGALSLYSLGCAISYGHYVIPECWVGTGLQRWFVPVALFNSLFCTSLSCYSRFVELRAPQWSKVLRTAAFVVPFIFDTVPLVHRLALCCGGGCGQTLALSSHSYHLLFALLTCFLFTSHLPERLAPGRFDYIGHSHQLFHVSAVVGTHFQMEGVLADMFSRRSWLLDHGGAPSFLGTIGVLLLGLILNLLIVGLFSAPLLWKRSKKTE